MFNRTAPSFMEQAKWVRTAGQRTLSLRLIRVQRVGARV